MPRNDRGATQRSGPRGRRPGRTLRGRREAHARAPRVVAWEVTRACELECVHCRAEARPSRDPRELTTDEGRRLLDEISAFGGRPPVVVFTGGDPLMRSDLWDLLRHARAAGLPTAVIPAPTRRVDRRTVERLKEVGVRRMAVSVDGRNALRHDGFRREPGSFEAALQAAAHAREIELPLQVNTTVTRATARDLPAISRLVEQEGAAAWEVFFLVPVGRGRNLAAPDAQETERILEWLYRRRRQAPFRVMTVEAPHYRRVAVQTELREGGRARFVGTTSDGNGFMFVDHTGEVCPSGFLPVSVGNVRKVSPVELYRHSRLFRDLRDRDQLEGKCGSCEFRFLCGGSRARAWAVTGNWMAPDPFCAYRPEGWSDPEASGGRPLPQVGRRAYRGRGREGASSEGDGG